MSNTMDNMKRRALAFSRVPWKRLEMEEQAEARRLMSLGIARIQEIPYAPGEKTLVPNGDFTVRCQQLGCRCVRAPLDNYCLDCGRYLG